MIMNCIMNFEGLVLDHDSSKKVVSFGVHVTSTFHGIKIRVFTYLEKKYIHFCIPNHCATHRTNLVVLTLFNLPIVMKIEALLQGVYAYFTQIHVYGAEQICSKLRNLHM